MEKKVKNVLKKAKIEKENDFTSFDDIKLNDEVVLIEDVNDDEEELVETEESVLAESLLIDTDKLSDELEEMKKEIFEEKKEEEDTVKEVKVEEKEVKKNKINNRMVGLIWNGQSFGF